MNEPDEGFNSLSPKQSSMTTISTQPVKGMRDILGKEARLKRKVEALITERASRYGFEPMQLPVLENLDVLTVKGGGGEEAVKELFTLEDQSKRKLGMRFEHTTSLARVLAGNPDLPKPIKALNLGTVYRYDNPQALRYREFTQADCDIIGVKGEAAEAECLLLGIDVMRSLGVEGFYFRINDRRITNELLLLTQVPPEKAKEAMRSLDKLDKIGIEGVKKDLESKGLSTDILAYLESTLPEIKRALKEANLDLTGVNGLEGLMKTLDAQDKLDYVTFDPSLVRGLEYYTGPVWEIFGGVSASVGSGGRYDNLIRSLGGPDLPAVGISFGVDRLVSVILEKWNEPPLDVFVIPIGNVFEEAQLLTNQLREEGLRVDIDLMQRGVGKNLNYANTKQIPVVVFAGEDELKEKSVKIRNMKSGEEKMVKIAPISTLVKEIREILAK
jgi:histidyl-tRNA synthetase